jgi:BCD family chlorophyll transporter-like MFS transporter
MGTLMQVGGFAIMPFALLVLAGAGQADKAPAWVGHMGAAVAFLLVGAGVHTTQTVGLALATDLAPEPDRPKVVGLMYVMLLVGMIASALVMGELLADYSPGQLIQVVQGTALLTMVLNVVAVWKQEPRSRLRKPGTPTEGSFSQAWHKLKQGPHALRRLYIAGLGTMAFTMEDVLLEPYGGEVLGMSVSSTTLLTATLAAGGLMGFAWASQVLARGADPMRMARLGAWLGVPAFAAVILSAPLGSVWVFGSGVFLIGVGGGLFAHGTLTNTMQMAPKEQVGLALGAWGAVQATGGGLGMALGGVLRDIMTLAAGTASGYSVVYALEIVLLMVTLLLIQPLLGSRTAPN